MYSRPLSALNLPFPTLSALTRGGYETLGDLQSVSAQTLAKGVGISLQAAEAALDALQIIPTPLITLPQSAASMTRKSQMFSTKLPALDELLSGGLIRGHILEISGPPGTPKETIAMNITRSFVEVGEEVIFIDSQNMSSPATLSSCLRKSPSLPSNYLRLVYHLNIQLLPELMIFVRNLPTLLESRPKTALLVLNSISFPFQTSASMTVAARTALLGMIKQVLTIVSGSRNLTVVLTSQLSTKLLNADGSPGSFDTGTKGVMVPQLGTTHLPLGRASRIIVSRSGPQTWNFRLLSSPTYHPGADCTPPTATYDESLLD